MANVNKKLATVEKLAEQLSRLGADRNSVVIAFGGGVVGDTAGLAASLYMRGIDLIQIPTTVLAQVDASIGGKTAVNLRAGKNLVGTFHHPRMVLIDPGVLSSLPDREFRAGLYESLKCGVIGKPELFRALENIDLKKLRRDPAKAGMDHRGVGETEGRSGLVRRAGKWSPPRVKPWPHHWPRTRGGNRIPAFSARRSSGLGNDRIGHTLPPQWTGLTGSVPRASRMRVRALGTLPRVQSRSRDLLRLLQSDKKTRNGVVHFVLPREIGKVEIVNDVPEQVVIEAV